MMGKRIKDLYIKLLKQGWRAETKMTEDGVCEIWILKDRPGSFYVDGFTESRFFRLYPRNPYTNKFDESSV